MLCKWDGVHLQHTATCDYASLHESTSAVDQHDRMRTIVFKQDLLQRDIARETAASDGYSLTTTLHSKHATPVILMGCNAGRHVTGCACDHAALMRTLMLEVDFSPWGHRAIHSCQISFNEPAYWLTCFRHGHGKN
jgi:hypothetical protein